MSTSAFDAVLSFHTTAETCGVAKFSKKLAQRLGIPFDELSHWQRYGHPLLSLKREEWDVWPTMGCVPAVGQYSVLWHGEHVDWIDDGAADIFDARELGCPNLIEGDGTRGEIHIITLGMAHKLHVKPYEKLKQLLDATRRPYTVGISTAVHEKAPWDGIGVVAEQMRHLFGPRVRSLGYLGDDALVREFHAASAIAVFYDPAARANNTTLWTALTYGHSVITNLDEHSPKELVHGISVWDLAQLDEYPDDADVRRQMRGQMRKVLDRYNWQSVIDALTKSEVPA